MKAPRPRSFLAVGCLAAARALAAALGGFAFVAGLVACSDAPLTNANGTESRPGSSSSTTPTTTEGEPDAAAPVKPSGCPDPPLVAPADAPSGFLPAKTVTLVRVIDGDTAHFMIDGTETVVRFLYVNTEETHDTRTTQFGVDTAYRVEQYLKGAKELVVVREEDKKKKGSPHLDTYGRTLALVFTDGLLFQERLVREGWTPYYTQFGCALDPIHKGLLYSEAEARANERGVWAPGHPTDYNAVLADWIGSSTCRPNPFKQAYCK